MVKYEGIFLLKVDLDKEKLNDLTGRIKDTIKRQEAEILSAEFWREKQQLAYPIKKQKEAHYYLVNFKAEPSVISKIDQEFRINENILRFMIIKLKR